MSTTIQRAAHPFQTSDGELALALFTAGCKPAPHEADGPAVNLYTANTCRNRWRTVRNATTGEPNRVPLLTHKNVYPDEFEKSVMLAEQLKIPGNVTYAIVQCPIFQKAIKCRNDWADEFEAAERDSREPKKPDFSVMNDEEIIMTVFYFRQRNAESIKAMAWMRSPRLAMGDTKKELRPDDAGLMPKALQEERSYVETNKDSLKTWDLHLSDEKRATIMSDGKPFLHPKPKL